MAKFFKPALVVGTSYLALRQISKYQQQRTIFPPTDRRSPLEYWELDQEPDVIEVEGANYQRSLGRLAVSSGKKDDTRQINPKKYAPTKVPGIKVSGVTVLTAGSRFITLNPALSRFSQSRWTSIQNRIQKEEGPRAEAAWASVVQTVESGQPLPTIKQAMARWLATQRFKLAGIRPGMSPADLYATVTMGVGNTKKNTALPEWAAPSNKTLKYLRAFVLEHKKHAPELPPTLPTGNVLALLSVSAKVMKSVKKGYWTAVMYLAPATEAGFNVCAGLSAGCEAACLGHSTGQLTGMLQRVRRIRRTLHQLLFTGSFTGQLLQEIGMFRAHAFSVGLAPAVRLNGSSDIAFETQANGAIPQHFPDTQFYDYTKLPFAERKIATQLRLPDGRPQYHLTFSYSDRKDSFANSLAYLKAKANVAIVVGAAGVTIADSYHYTPDEGGYDTKGRKVFKPYLRSKPNRQARQQNAARAAIHYANTNPGGLYGYGAISGDETDARFEDPPGVWVVLYAKGAFAARDQSGFVFRVTKQGVPVELRRKQRFPMAGAAARGRRNASDMINWFESSLDRIC